MPLPLVGAVFSALCRRWRAICLVLAAAAWAPLASASVFPAPRDLTASLTLTVSARGDLAGGVGPIFEVWINGRRIAQQEVRSTTFQLYRFRVQALQPGDKVDLIYVNDGVVAGVDRNLYIGPIGNGPVVQMPYGPNVTFDRGVGPAALDGQDVLAWSMGNLYWAGAFRVVWSAAPGTLQQIAARNSAARFLGQTSFGPTEAAIDALVASTPAAWITQQMQLPAQADFVNAIQTSYNRGMAFRPGGSSYHNSRAADLFWRTAVTSPDQLRKRVAFALHQVFMVSLADSNLWMHARAYGHYLDTLNRLAFGNFRTLMEEMALSPVMGIYLSHIRNRPENVAASRQPDENFARELMQLFTIGLDDLNPDGTPRRDAAGNPIPSYTQADVSAMARVFTGWSWAFPDGQLTQDTFYWGEPNYEPGSDTRLDLLPMKPYPGQHSTSEKRLFTGKPWAVTIPANTSARESLRLALDALFQHPNVGPFIGRQLIQRLVTSNPSPAYVARVAAAFQNNGQGQRGDMAAVVRAVLLDAEARTDTAVPGKLREPVLRTTLAMRALGVASTTGEFMMSGELANQAQQAMYAPSVFGYNRPGFVPPNTAFAATGATMPEFQLVSEATTAHWANFAQALVDWGVGWNGTGSDVRLVLDRATTFTTRGDASGLMQYLDTQLFAGTMPVSLKNAILDAISGITGITEAHHRNRARLAVFLALVSPAYMAQP